jgi:hypothetical protein
MARRGFVIHRAIAKTLDIGLRKVALAVKPLGIDGIPAPGLRDVQAFAGASVSSPALIR